jgi:class 3 adenylate cyclase
MSKITLQNKKPLTISNRSNKKTPKKYTLKFTLISAFCGLSLFGALILTTVTLYQSNSFIREQLRLRITDVVNTMAYKIDGDIHSKIQTVADEKSVTFIELQRDLQAMRHRGTGITNAYTLRKMDNGDIILVVDGSKQNHNVVGDVYPAHAVTKTLLNAFNATPENEHGLIYTEPTIYENPQGVWLSAYAPIFTSTGKLDAIVAIDVSAQNIRDHELEAIISMTLTSVAVMFFILPLAFFTANRIRRPLERLTLEMEKIGKFELESDVEIVSRVSEIMSMSHQLEGMKTGLRSFKKYVPAELVKELVELGSDAKLGGEKKNLTIFFSDIANFTTISERLDPEKLVSFLGEYLDVMNLGLLKNQATVDKYIGDAVMAFWGAPRNVENQAIQSCRAALECQREILLLSQKWKSEGLDFDFYTRIGIHTGEVIVGNIGSDTRMNYTVIGDNVNVASRIESANKFYGTSTLISETIYREAKEEFVTRLVDYVVLVGKATPIRLYELVGNKGYVGDKTLRHIELYEKAFDCYSQRKFAEAIVFLEKLIVQTPSDYAATRLLERCQNYQINPPSENWQGEYVLASK